MKPQTETFETSKPRFEILDGLRGVAAMIVVAFHLFETYSEGPATQIINHGYLAVDFFFMLSGFVIGYAYDDRWVQGMTQCDFFKRRLIRLQPMVIMGAIIGALWYFFQTSDAFPLIEQTSWWMVLVIMLLAWIMFPTPPSMDIRGWQETSSLNGPQWSLMWEYLANILYATIIRHFSKFWLAIFVGLSGTLTIILCCDINLWGILNGREYAAYSVIGGWSLTPCQLFIGITRLLFPFFGGLLIYRIGAKLKLSSYGFFICSILLAVVLCFPHIGGDKPNIINGFYCLISIMIFFPVIVMTGAGSPLTGRYSIAVCKWLGEISYPLYITHYPLIYMQVSWLHNHPNAPIGTQIFLNICVFIIAVAVAYASLKLYDLPVREWLKNKFLYSKSRK
ncbi:acyltransferase family protein [Xylanibacter rodentium]|uniref:acyltransferase family protein n=1 Tax=Xylanibacter rodentium TaxID=2736289 RepID=UPI0025830BAA|nr:acyltransferase [Xylanibacter rodentium]